MQELSLQALIGAEAGDAALIRTDVSDEFLDHLDRNGLPVPRVFAHPHSDPGSRFRPFGWSVEAIDLNRRHDEPAEHPSPQTIERVNSRSLALEIETELSAEGPAGRIVASLDELQAFLSAAPRPSEWVVKAEHGNSALANRRLRESRLCDADRRFVDGVLAEDDRLLVEPWLARERDWCVVFEVPFRAETLRIHEAFCTRDGALIGALFEPGGPEHCPWSDRLAELAGPVARRLSQAGYLGPACFDAFSWRDAAGLRLRVLADINCRHSMSEGAHRAWRQLAPERACYYRFFNRRKLDMPASLSAAVAALGELGYDRSRRRGILLASPPAFAKFAVIFIAENRTGIFALEAWFRERFET